MALFSTGGNTVKSFSQLKTVSLLEKWQHFNCIVQQLSRIKSFYNTLWPFIVKNYFWTLAYVAEFIVLVPANLKTFKIASPSKANECSDWSDSSLLTVLNQSECYLSKYLLRL